MGLLLEPFNVKHVLKVKRLNVLSYFTGSYVFVSTLVSYPINFYICPVDVCGTTHRKLFMREGFAGASPGET